MAAQSNNRFPFATYVVLLLGLCVIAAATWVQMPVQVESTAGLSPDTEVSYPARGALVPLLRAPELPADRVALGRALFSDPRLSADDTVSCASCHDLDAGGADGRRLSIGVDGAMGEVNAPTVFNAALNLSQFWDGRAATLEQQLVGPIHNPVEMASSWTEVVDKLSADGRYRTAFSQIYADGINADNIADAIATFERSLLTPDSPFDRYLSGDQEALSDLEVAGYRAFLDYGCASCHQGIGIGGNMYQRFGILHDYFAGRAATRADLGRYNVTGRDADRHVFKVPGLRNVALTAPYFHDGSADNLEQAVITMARYQLGRELSPDDVFAIVAFLNSLSGIWQGSTQH